MNIENLKINLKLEKGFSLTMLFLRIINSILILLDVSNLVSGMLKENYNKPHFKLHKLNIGHRVTTWLKAEEKGREILNIC